MLRLNHLPPIAYATVIMGLYLLAASHASAQLITYNITSNNTVVVTLSPMKFVFGNTTVVVVYPLNETHAKVVYTCVFINTTDECHSVAVHFLTTGWHWEISKPSNCTVYITESTVAGYPAKVTELKGLCMLTNITAYNPGNETIVVTDYTTGVSYRVTLMFPVGIAAPPLDVLNYLIPAAILVAFSLRGRVVDVGVGLVMFSITCFVLPWLGLKLPLWHLASVLAFIVGALILWFSRG